MKKMMAVLLVLVMAASLAACTQATETIYVHTESLRTIGEAEIKMVYAYSDDGTPISVKTYFNGDLYQTTSTRVSGGIQYLTITDADGNTTTQSTEQKYDDNGRLVQSSSSVGGTEVAYTNYTYDDAGMLVGTVSVTAASTVHAEMTYDANGNLISEVRRDQNSGAYQRKEYAYDAEGRLVKESTYSAEDVLDGYVVSTYNGSTEKTLTYYGADDEPTGEVYVETYDEHGNKIKEVATLDGEVIMTIVNTYVAMEVPVKD